MKQQYIVHPNGGGKYHPSVVIGENVSIGKGSLIRKGCSILENTWIGNNVVIRSDSVIGKSVRIHDNVRIGKNVCLGDYCYIRVNTVIEDDVRLQKKVSCGRNCFFGKSVFISEGIEIQEERQFFSGICVNYFLGLSWAIRYAGFDGKQHWVCVGCRQLPIKEMLKHLRTKPYKGTTPPEYLESLVLIVRSIESHIKAMEKNHG